MVELGIDLYMAWSLSYYNMKFKERSRYDGFVYTGSIFLVYIALTKVVLLNSKERLLLRVITIIYENRFIPFNAY